MNRSLPDETDFYPIAPDCGRSWTIRRAWLELIAQPRIRRNSFYSAAISRARRN